MRFYGIFPSFADLIAAGPPPSSEAEAYAGVRDVGGPDSTQSTTQFYEWRQRDNSPLPFPLSIDPGTNSDNPIGGRWRLSGMPSAPWTPGAGVEQVVSFRTTTEMAAFFSPNRLLAFVEESNAWYDWQAFTTVEVHPTQPAADGYTAVACTSLPDGYAGQYQLITATSVKNLTELANINNRLFSQVRVPRSIFVQSLNAVFDYQPSSGQVADGLTIVNPWDVVTYPNARWVKRSSTNALLVLRNGDSLTGTGGAVPMLGASAIALFTEARTRGLKIKSFGRLVQGRPGYQAPYEIFSDGNSGYLIEDLTALWGGAPTGTVPVPLTKNFVLANGPPDVVSLMIGTNNVSALGDTGATCWAKLQTLLAQITSVCPGARVLVHTIPQFYTPAAPSGGLATANTRVSDYNSSIRGNVELLNPFYTTVDTAAQLSVNTAYTDGYHLTIEGQAIKGHLEAEFIAQLFPLARGPVMPTDFKPRVQQSSVRLPTKGTSKLQSTADNGWRLPASNFLIGCRSAFLDIQSGTVPYWLTSYPAGTNSASGWAVAIDTTTATYKLNVYLTSLGGIIGTAIPVVIDQPFWFFLHGDYGAGIVTAFMAYPLSLSAQRGSGAWVVAQIGAATGVSWSQGAANPLMNVGNDNVGRAGVACVVDNLFMSAGSPVPGIFGVGQPTANDPGDLMEIIEGIVFRGESAPSVQASVRCTEGTGATAASAIGGATMTITTGGWMNPGEIVWPSDEDASATPPNLAVVAMADANQTLPPTSFNATTIEATGALTADRNLVLPRRKGFVYTVNNKTTGAHNVQAIGLTGTGVNIAPGIGRVYFDGTNFVAA